MEDCQNCDAEIPVKPTEKDIKWNTCRERDHKAFSKFSDSKNGTNMEDKEPYIAYGEPAKEGDYPWLGLFRRIDLSIKQPRICGSSLLNGRFLLTAAHCCDNGFTPTGKPAPK